MIVLRKSDDWDIWYSFVRTRAVITGIWEIVNPEKAVRPEFLPTPSPPEFELPAASDTAYFDSGAYKLYKARRWIYELELARFESQRKAISDLINYVQDTLTVQTAIYIQHVEPHPWNLLRTLKHRLEPSDMTRSFQIVAKYHRLCEGLGKQDMEEWLDEWQTTYTLAEAYNIAESKGARPLRDFLFSIKSKEPVFATTHLVALKRNQEIDFHELIKDFRWFIRHRR